MFYKVSVIIPVYNSERYLAHCVESLVSQTLKECEFIFINDGSSDKSQQMIEGYKKADKRIKLINQTNQGVSSARNKGLAQAKGEYIGFIDADDYIEKNMFETLYQAAVEKNVDIVISNFESEIDGHKTITQYPFLTESTLQKEYIQKTILPYFLEHDNLNAVWNKLYSRKLLCGNNITFPEDRSLGEDGLFNMHSFSVARIVMYTDYAGYHYREVKGSATKNIVEKDYFKNALEVYHLELPQKLMSGIDQVKMRQLKSVKLLKSVMSTINIYFYPSKDVSFIKRYNYIKKMINNAYIIKALSAYYDGNYQASNRYEKVLINLINKKSIVGLYFAVTYSRIKNK